MVVGLTNLTERQTVERGRPPSLAELFVNAGRDEATLRRLSDAAIEAGRARHGTGVVGRGGPALLDGPGESTGYRDRPCSGALSGVLEGSREPSRAARARIRAHVSATSR